MKHREEGRHVQVIARQGPRAQGKVIAAYPEQRPRPGRGRQPRSRSTPRSHQTAARRQDRRHRHAGGPDPRQQRAGRRAPADGKPAPASATAAARPTERQDAQRARLHSAATEGHLMTHDHRRRTAGPPRLKAALPRARSRRRCTSSSATPTSCRSPASSRSSSTWVSARPPSDSKLIDGAVRDLTAITGQKPQRRRATQVHRAVQAARGHADRRAGHPARRPDVGVPRPAAVARAAPHP